MVFPLVILVSDVIREWMKSYFLSVCAVNPGVHGSKPVESMCFAGACSYTCLSWGIPCKGESFLCCLEDLVFYIRVWRIQGASLHSTEHLSLVITVELISGD